MVQRSTVHIHTRVQQQKVKPSASNWKILAKGALDLGVWQILRVSTLDGYIDVFLLLQRHGNPFFIHLKHVILILVIRYSPPPQCVRINQKAVCYT